jgi:hypothetical protein
MRVAGAILAAVTLGSLAAAPADAATIGVVPVKPCYRAGETVGVGGSGYTPSSKVQINANGRVVGTTPTDAAGSFGGGLTLGLASGERVKTYSAVDTTPGTNNSASVQLRVSRLNARVRPLSSRPGVARITALGFTTGKTLYAHVVHAGRNLRNVRIGRLTGACRKLSVRRRVFSGRSSTGTYTLQFDTRRHYSSDTAVAYLVPAYWIHASGAAAAQAWTSG